MPFIIRLGNEDVERFSLASLDANPLHCSDDYARKTSFGQRVAHGMLGFLASLRGLTVPDSATPSRITIDFKAAMLPDVAYELRVVSESIRSVKAIVTDGSTTVTRFGIEFGNAEPDLAELSDAATAPRRRPRSIPIDELTPGVSFRGRYGPPQAAYLELLKHFGIARTQWGDGLLLTILACSYLTGMELPGESALLWSLNAEILPPRPEVPSDFEIAVTHCDRRFAMIRSQFCLGSGPRVFARGEVVATVRPSPAKAAVSRTEPLSTQFKGKRAIVVGASRGLGAAFSLELAAGGASVVGLYSQSRDDADELLSASRDLPGRLTLEQGDAGDPNWCRVLKQRVRDELGSVDLLICNAAPAIQPLLVEDACFDRIRAYVDRGLALVGAPLSSFLDLVAASHGCVIVISSAAVESPPPHWPQYVALKAAAEGLTRAAAAHYRDVTFVIARPDKIRTSFSSTPLGLVDAEDASTVARRILESAGALTRSASRDTDDVHFCR